MSTSPRLERLRQATRERDLDAVVVSSWENRLYFSGFEGSAGYLLVSPSEAVLGTDFRYVEQAGRQAPGFRVERLAPGMTWLPKLASELGVRRIGFEDMHMTVSTHAAFEKAIAGAQVAERVELSGLSGALDDIRSTKYGEEMDLLARAIEITDQAFEQVASTIKAGVTEREVAWAMERAMRERGADGAAFDIIVGAGPNAALPHHRADGTVIGDGQPVVIDMGARYRGYCADLTRTIIVGEPDDRFWPVYDTVLRAQTEAIELVEPGMTGAEADAISRDVIAEAGYGENFGHSLGHGVGLAVHEAPGVGPNASDILEDGMVFTIEPGIYLPGWGGVRIEDIVVLEGGRARVVSRAPKLFHNTSRR